MRNQQKRNVQVSVENWLRREQAFKG